MDPAFIDLHRSRILVVVDQEASQRVLSELLSGLTLDHVMASTADEALKLLYAAQRQGNAFTVALIDHTLPGTASESLARAIASDHALQGTRLVLMSSRTTVDCRSMLTLGYEGVLVKPVRQSALMNALAGRWVAAGKAPSESDPDPPPTHGPPDAGTRSPEQRILVVEDNGMHQVLAVRLLEKLGHAVDVAATGREALQMLELGPYVLVLMDCQMPDMDGYDATRAIRAGETRARGVPIVGLAAHASGGDREKCLEAGMDDYLGKPVTIDALDRTVRRWLGAQRTAGLTPAPAPGEVDPIRAPLVDFSRLEDILVYGGESGGNLLRELVDIFKASAQPLAKTVGETHTARDGRALMEAAHSLKGASLNLGLARVGEICMRLERIAGSDPDLTGAGELVELLEAELAAAIRAVDEYMSHRSTAGDRAGVA